MRSRGRMNCLWAMYQDDKTGTGDMAMSGECEKQEDVYEMLPGACSGRSTGSVAIMRKHIPPTWDELGSGGHFRIEDGSSTAALHPPSLDEKMDFVFDVVTERLVRSSSVAGVMLSFRSGASVIVSLWLIGCDGDIVDTIRKDLTKTWFQNRATVIRFVHHKTIPSAYLRGHLRGGKKALVPLLEYLDNPINFHDLPKLDDDTSTSLQAFQFPARSVEELGASLVRDSWSTTNLGSTNAAAIGSGSFSVHEGKSSSVHEGKSSSVRPSLSDGMPAPTPVTDWASSWSPSLLLQTQVNPVEWNTGRKTSSSNESTSAREPTSHSADVSPQTLALNTAALFHSGGHPMTSMVPVAFDSVSHPFPHGAAHSTLPSMVVPFMVSSPGVAHGALSPQPAAVPPPPPRDNRGTSAPPQAVFSQYLPQPHYVPQHYQPAYPNALPAGPVASAHQFMPAFAPYALAPPTVPQVHQPYRFVTSGMPPPPPPPPPPALHAAPPPPPPPPSHLTSVFTQKPPSSAQAVPRPPQKPAVPSPPQSDRKAFVFKGVAYPPGMNRKEYRQIVHHNDEQAMASCTAAFPVPPGVADGNIEMETYETLKTEHLLAQVRDSKFASR